MSTHNPPASPEAEAAILGSILINPEAIVEVAEIGLGASDFFLTKNRSIFEAMLSLYENASGETIPIDAVTVLALLEQRGQDKEVGGLAYLTQLLTSVPTSVHAPAYARQVQNLAIDRGLLAACSEIAKIAYSNTAENPEMRLEIAHSLIDKVQPAIYQNGSVSFAEAAWEQYANVKLAEAKRSAGQETILPSHLPGLNSLLGGGAQQGELILVIGRAGAGKSIFLSNWAEHAARHGHPSLIFSLEMPKEQYAKRYLSKAAPSYNQKTGNLDEAMWVQLTDAITQIKDLPWRINDDVSLTPTSIAARVRKEVREHSIQMVVVDYMQLLRSGLGDKAGDTEVIDHIARALKYLARQANVAVVAASTVRREYGSQRTNRSHLRGGEGPVHDADTILALNEEEEEPLILQGVRQYKRVALRVDKARDGSTGNVPLVLFEDTLRLEELNAFPDS